MDGSNSLLIRTDSSLALRCRKGAIHPILDHLVGAGEQGARPDGMAGLQSRRRHPRRKPRRSGGAMTIAIAPGGPGSRPTWTSSAKDMVTTALGTSRVWVTLGYGILNEVYWPATGLPQIRDLGFI